MELVAIIIVIMYLKLTLKYHELSMKNIRLEQDMKAYNNKPQQERIWGAF